MKTSLSMKQVVLVALGTSMVAACGGEGTEQVERVSSALVTWTSWVSEEQPAGTQCGDVAQGATRAACRGSYCDDMRLFCGTLPQGFVNIPGTANDYWTNYISEETTGLGNSVFCYTGYGQLTIIDGIRATGSYSDNVSVHCAASTIPSWGMNCAWSPWFSEEQGDFGQNFDVSTQSYAWAVAVGVRCSNSYCDNMSYYICEPKCRSNADCFSACNADGVCVVG